MRECFSARLGARSGLIVVGMVALLGTGCVVHHHHPDGGPVVVHRAPGHGHPPPHAPAHGHRRKHANDGVELVFDGDLGVYVVVGRPGLYWHGDRYFVWRDGGWRVSARIDGVWVSVASQDVPVKLAARHRKGKHHDDDRKARPRGRYWGVPAKHGY